MATTSKSKAAKPKDPQIPKAQPEQEKKKDLTSIDNVFDYVVAAINAGQK